MWTKLDTQYRGGRGLGKMDFRGYKKYLLRKYEQILFLILSLKMLKSQHFGCPGGGDIYKKKKLIKFKVKKI